MGRRKLEIRNWKLETGNLNIEDPLAVLHACKPAEGL